MIPEVPVYQGLSLQPSLQAQELGWLQKHIYNIPMIGNYYMYSWTVLNLSLFGKMFIYNDSELPHIPVEDVFWSTSSSQGLAIKGMEHCLLILKWKWQLTGMLHVDYGLYWTHGLYYKWNSKYLWNLHNLVSQYMYIYTIGILVRISILHLLAIIALEWSWSWLTLTLYRYMEL